jgi:site-specific recombinase XerD
MTPDNNASTSAIKGPDFSGRDASAGALLLAPPSLSVTCEILILQFSGIGAMPVLILNGHIACDVLEWIGFEKVRRKLSQSTLYRYAISVRYFCDFCCSRSNELTSTSLFGDFFEARTHGYLAIGWKSVSTKTAKQNLESINRFIDWYSESRNIQKPNPKIEISVSWVEMTLEQERRNNSHLLSHLFRASKRSRSKSIRSFSVTRRADRGVFTRTKPSKGFRFEDYVLLLRHECNPRNKMLWLLLGAGGCRLCEALNLFLFDITCNPINASCEVLLVDPVYGPACVPAHGREWMSRKSYLASTFHAIPREELPFNSVQYVGWKGMKFQEGATAGVSWLHPYFGKLAWSTHTAYLSLRGTVCGNKHPWYFANFKTPVGEPLTANSVKSAFSGSCKRLGLRPPHNVHSLRHMYVTFLIQILGLSDVQAQYLVRHSTPTSTREYVDLQKDLVHRSMEAAAQRPDLFEGVLAHDENW